MPKWNFIYNYKFASIFFYAIGTCILLMVLLVVLLNFYNDSNWIAANSSIASPVIAEQKNEEKISDADYQTLKYKRAYEPPVPEEKSSTADNSKNDKPKTTGVSVELINYLTMDGVAEKIKARLTNEGFVVTIINPTKTTNKTTNTTTTIIERNDKGVGLLLQKVLKSGVIKKDLKTNYNFDLTLILANDYNP